MGVESIAEFVENTEIKQALLRAFRGEHSGH